MAPGRFLTVAQPRVDARLTPRLQLRSYRPPPTSRGDEQSAAQGGAAWPRRFQPRARLATDLWRPLSRLDLAWKPRRARGASADSIAPSSKGTTYPGSERLPSTSAPRTCFRRVRARGTRHRALGFAAVSTASDASSPPAALALEG